MTPQDWRDWASVFEAGAERHRSYGYNSERQQQAEALRAQAARCLQIAFDRDPAGTAFAMTVRQCGASWPGRGDEVHRLWIAYPPWLDGLLESERVDQAWGTGQTRGEAEEQAKGTLARKLEGATGVQLC